MIPNEYFSKARKLGFFLGALTIVLWFLAKNFPDYTEHFYARLLYPFIASNLALLGSYMPVAVTGLIFASIVLWFLAIPFRQYKINKEMGLAGLGIHILLSILSTSCFLVFIFSLAFLFNHHRYTEEKLFQLDFNLDKIKYQQLVDVSVPQANALSARFVKNERGCSEIDFDLVSYDQLVEQEQEKFLEQQGLPSVKNAKSRYFLFSYLWGGMGVGGQYQPLLGQTNVTQELPDYTKPYIIGHERGHLNGFASEAGASLLGMQTLFHAQDSRLRYLGLLGMWRKSLPDSVNEQVAKDVQCWNEDYERMHRFKYKTWFTKINDTYLKMSGHKDGVQSYDRGHLLGLKYYYLNFVKNKTLENSL